VEGQADANKDVDTITGLARKYCWWMARNMKEEKRKANEKRVVLV
jgi:hypothetical protein